VFRLDLPAEHASALVRAFEQLIARLENVDAAIAAPIAAGLDSQGVYLAMEYAMGEPLDVTPPSSPMGLSEVIAIVDVAAEALDRGAARGVHHGLLHPRDIIVGPHQQLPRGEHGAANAICVTGLGIAEALSSIGIPLPVRRPYEPADGPSDVYALAAIAYELISGRRMTPGGWDELSAEDGPQLRDAFAAALSGDPRSRPSRAGDFAQMLRAAGASASASRDAPDVDLLPQADDPEFDTAALGRFADLGAVSDLQQEFAAPREPSPLPPSEIVPESGSAAELPSLFQSEETSSQSGGHLKLAGVVLAVLAICFFGGYLWRARAARQPASASTLPKTQPVTSTTVDLPSAASIKPNEPKPPAKAAASADAASRSAPAASPPSTALGRLLVRSTPADAAVIVNGEARGKTPLAVRDLPLGSYTIHLARNGYAEEDRRVRLTAKRPAASLIVELKPAHTAAVGHVPIARIESRGSLSVQSRPAGARVFVNGRPSGATPLTVPGVPAASATVRIEKDGYATWTTTVQVKAGQETVVTASLDRN